MSYAAKAKKKLSKPTKHQTQLTSEGSLVDDGLAADQHAVARHDLVSRGVGPGVVGDGLLHSRSGGGVSGGGSGHSTWKVSIKQQTK